MWGRWDGTAGTEGELIDDQCGGKSLGATIGNLSESGADVARRDAGARKVVKSGSQAIYNALSHNAPMQLFSGCFLDPNSLS